MSSCIIVKYETLYLETSSVTWLVSCHFYFWHVLSSVVGCLAWLKWFPHGNTMTGFKLSRSFTNYLHLTCPPECKLTPGGHEFAGPLNTTRSGRLCQNWASSQPHYNYYTQSVLYPEGSASGAGIACRNPDFNWNRGPWCYTQDRRKRWEACTVPFCG